MIQDPLKRIENVTGAVAEAREALRYLRRKGLHLAAAEAERFIADGERQIAALTERLDAEDAGYEAAAEGHSRERAEKMAREAGEEAQDTEVADAFMRGFESFYQTRECEECGEDYEGPTTSGHAICEPCHRDATA